MKMDIYTVSFFGHKEIENWCEIESRLENMIQKLIAQKEYIEFLVGRDGEFDLLVSSVIRRVWLWQYIICSCFAIYEG